MRPYRVMAVVMATAALALTACGGDEDDPMGGGHSTVAGAALYSEDGAPLTEPIGLIDGETMRFEVRFLDEEGEPIGGLRPGHDAGLVFEPATLATPVADHDDTGFFFDVAVTGAVAATGEVFVGYGHAGNTDEETFGPFDVVVVDVVE